MKTSESIENISKAYVECAVELINIAKDAKGQYKYTSLEKLIEHTKPVLHKHGLSIMQVPTGNGILTRMIHNSGEWYEQELVSDVVELRNMNIYQSQGSQITYLRRYAWASICGIASDDDMDAQGEQVKHEPKPKPQPQSKPQESKVSHNQVKLIQTRLSKLEDKEANETALKAHYKIDSWNDLPATAMPGLIEWMDKKGV